MSKKTVEFYTPKQVSELRTIKSLNGRKNRSNALKEWATQNNRTYIAAFAKMSTLNKIKVPRLKPLGIMNTLSSGGIVIRLPIKTLTIENNQLLITC